MISWMTLSVYSAINKYEQLISIINNDRISFWVWVLRYQNMSSTSTLAMKSSRQNGAVIQPYEESSGKALLKIWQKKKRVWTCSVTRTYDWLHTYIDRKHSKLFLDNKLQHRPKSFGKVLQRMLQRSICYHILGFMATRKDVT